MNESKERILSNRERLEQKRKLRRKKSVLRTLSLIAVAAIFIGAVKLVSFTVSSLLNKNIVFTTKLEDTVSPRVTNTLSAKDENDLVYIAKITPTDPKVCYLTFDDGPNNTVTLRIADILRRYNAKATFFQVGSLIEEHPDVTRRLHSEGHLIANHSYAHNYKELYASSESFMNEITHTEEVIKNTLGTVPFRLIRFPGGSHNAGKYKEIKQECKEILKNSEYFYCDWNCLTGDAEGKSKNPDELLAYLKETMKDQAQPVILMHDAVSKKNTVEAMPMILEYLISQGYTFDTLDHMRTE